MDTTPETPDPIEHVHTLLEQVTEADPADAVEPLNEIAEILEGLLDGDDA